MANQILEAIETVAKEHHDFVEIIEKRQEKLEKGQEAYADELGQQVDKLNTDLGKAIKERDTLIKEQRVLQERIEIVEAEQERPKGSPEERMEDEYKELFFEGVRTRFQDHEVVSKMQTLDRKYKELKAVTIGTDAAGGYGLPKEIVGPVDKLILAKSDIMNEIKMVQVGTSDYQELITLYGGTSGWVAETGTRSETGTPLLRNCKPTWGELYAYPKISEHSAQDIYFNVENWLMEDISDGMAVALSTVVHSGNGTDKPTGMTNSAPTTVGDDDSPIRAAAVYEFIETAGSPATTLVSDDIYSLVYGLRAGYRQGSKFAMNSATQGVVRKLKDSNGQYLWQPSLQLGQPDQLVGYPVFTWEDMADAGTLNALPISFGNFSRAYVMAYRNEMAMTVDANITTPGYIKFYVRRRWGGLPLNNNAVKFLKQA